MIPCSWNQISITLDTEAHVRFILRCKQCGRRVGEEDATDKHHDEMCGLPYFQLGPPRAAWVAPEGMFTRKGLPSPSGNQRSGTSFSRFHCWSRAPPGPVRQTFRSE
ncbi:hypothetical protein NDU88_006014 [Pleurodeles waltl]|uniref:Uncharacterized protein n=1 Tax=Pleurodeles waltl TaxID=8319 RepID=A0AAV7QGH8_PLEWA|nr:hypothetical protein NDU88_006014 [Pleurodeles waltl]